MAALSFYSNSNWDSFPQWDSEVAAIDDPELQSLRDAWNADDYSVDLNALFEQNNSGNSSSSLLPYYDIDNGSGGVPFDNTLVNSFDELESFNYYYPKRQRLSNSDELYPSYFDPCLTVLQDYAPPEIPMPMLLPPLPLLLPEFSIGSVEKREEAGGGGLSAQSIAARQRRRRITDKTRELGKLVPGGQKMNTAEMLESARKYIKFMQAQVALLESVPPPPHQEVTLCEGGEEFQKLLESPLIQEKLYSTENCLLPVKYVEQLGSEYCDGAPQLQLLKANPHFLEKK